MNCPYVPTTDAPDGSDMLATPCLAEDGLDAWSQAWLAYCNEHEGSPNFGVCTGDWQCQVECEPSGDTCTP